MGVHFAIEAAIPLAAQEAEDVLGGEVDRGVIQQPRIQTGQRLATGEQQVGGVLGLIDDPVIRSSRGTSSRSKGLTCRAQRSRIFGQLSLAKRSASVGLVGVVELGERVVLLHEAQLLLHHLLGQPFVAIDVDLDGEREPGLQADVDQAELGIEEVVVEDPLLPASR